MYAWDQVVEVLEVAAKQANMDYEVDWVIEKGLKIIIQRKMVKMENKQILVVILIPWEEEVHTITMMKFVVKAETEAMEEFLAMVDLCSTIN